MVDLKGLLHLRKHGSQILADKQAIGPDHSTVTWVKTRAVGEVAQEKLATRRDSAHLLLESCEIKDCMITVASCGGFFFI